MLGASGVFLAALLVAGSASSQTMSVEGGRISRNSRPVSPTTRLWINQDDCYADDVLHFPLLLKGNVGLSTSVWGAHDTTTDCFQKTARSSASSNCRMLFFAMLPEGETPIDLRVQDLLVPSWRGPDPGTSEICRATGQVDFSPQPLTLWFMNLVGDAQSETAGVSLSWASRYDLVPPEAPVASIAMTDEVLTIRWSSGRDTDVAGYRIYCDPADVQPAREMGVADIDGGSDDLPCSASTISPSSSPPPASYLYYGDDPSLTMEKTLVELKDGRRYACVVAAYDEAGNVSATSNVVCGTSRIRHGAVDLNGRGGCGCLVAARQSQGIAPLRWIAACFAVALARARRRRSRGRT